MVVAHLLIRPLRQIGFKPLVQSLRIYGKYFVCKKGFRFTALLIDRQTPFNYEPDDR
jgi:hypothetical protein